MVEGTKHELTCEIINVAPVKYLTVKWYRDSEVVHTETFNDTSLTPVNASSTLIVTPESNYDGTHYKCVTELHLGPNGPETVSKESAPYTADVHYKPHNLSCPQNFAGVEHHISMDKVPCHADGNPRPTVHWYNKGVLINGSEPLTRTQSGEYTAVFKNSIGNISTIVDITVEYSPSFTCDDHYDVKENDNPQTTCKPAGMPMPSVTWFKDGQNVTLPPLWTSLFGGKYLLRATNKHGHADHTLHLNVSYKPHNLSCPQNFAGVEHHISMDKVPCHADGNPRPTVHWYNNGVLINGSEPLTRTQSGEYTAVFKNSIGNISTIVDITVEYSPSFTCDDHYDVKENDNPQTTCKPAGMPMPSVTWFKDGQNGTLPPLWTSDFGGKYLLRATNKHGHADHTLHLNVSYAPVFNEGNYSMEVTLGENVTFNFSAKGNPNITIMWKFNPEKNVNVTTGGSNTVVSITGATSTNDGVYLCTASNTIGTVTRSVILRVKLPGSHSRSSPLSVSWLYIFIIILGIVAATIIILCIWRKLQSKKRGQYTFLPDKVNERSEIPMTPVSNGKTNGITV
ncbi:intercellular adhesion molecule 5 [Scomber japonicus]|uniref:intercellular adhesion molecule 5 n=1 Tax=Scomber japonicus TaxID=13676 RepID=UPI002306050D|nr:intercellular adhesion molecule 5 [Scomber japonicus]